MCTILQSLLKNGCLKKSHRCASQKASCGSGTPQCLIDSRLIALSGASVCLQHIGIYFQCYLLLFWPEEFGIGVEFRIYRTKLPKLFICEFRTILIKIYGITCRFPYPG